MASQRIVDAGCGVVRLVAGVAGRSCCRQSGAVGRGF